MYELAAAVSLDSTPESCARQDLTHATVAAALKPRSSGADMDTARSKKDLKKKILSLSLSHSVDMQQLGRRFVAACNVSVSWGGSSAPAAAAAVAAPAGPVRSLGFGAW